MQTDNSPATSVVIIGGGQAGLEAAAALRTQGFAGRVTLICEEAQAPYQRPPLSKDYLHGKQEADRLPLRAPAFFENQNIELLLNTSATKIDRAARTVELRKDVSNGQLLPFDYLILAMGARNRPLPIEGAGRAVYLRSLPEAQALRERMPNATSVAVIGGGFIGLEAAAAARHYGKAVSVIETLPRLMARAVSPVVSQFFLDLHTKNGVNVLLPAAAVALDDGGVALTDGRHVPADLVIAGIGVIPETSLARDAGLAVGNGIVVDEFLRTVDEFLQMNDPRIFAIGDCAQHPNCFSQTGAVRLESVQNAIDQAKCAARGIIAAGKGLESPPYADVPWFWTDQFDVRFQMAGLSAGHDQQVLRGSVEDGKFSLFYFKNGQLIAADSVNRLTDHIGVRKLLGARRSITEEQAADPNLDLRKL